MDHYPGQAPQLIMRKLDMLGLYVGLLLLSHLVRLFQADPGPLPEGMSRVELPEYDGAEATGELIEVAYRDVPATFAQIVQRPVVLLPGSPFASRSMQPLIDELAGKVRVIAVDLPGFGASTRDVSDYSFEAQARTVLDLLNHLEINSAHVAAFGVNGGVALQMKQFEPGRVASIELVSAIGVQELELLGDYDLNHILHGLQYGVVWFVQEFVPHFGLLDRFPVNTSYARQFLDSDQRPLREILEKYDGPMVIVHATGDWLIPVVAAREHARIVPQSQFVEVSGGHYLHITDPQVIADPLAKHLLGVELGIGKSRATAEPGRLEAAKPEFDWNLHADRGVGFQLTAAAMLGAATLASEDLACISGGLMVARGGLSFFGATMGCLLGILIGDVLLFLAGRYLGARALMRRPLRWFIKPESVERCAAVFQRRGAALVFASRFVPGLRLPTYFAAGATGMRLRSFLLYFAVAAAVWTPLLVGISAFVGDPILTWGQRAGRWSWLIAIGGLIGFWILVRVTMLIVTWRGRRLLLGWWRRTTRWEFWPSWVIYPPVVVYIIYLGFKHNNGFMDFTSVNPCMLFGGLLGESKSQILASFGPDAPEIPKFTLLENRADVSQSIDDLAEFMEEEGLSFPVVLKPDVGERGQGVAIIRSWEEATEYFRVCAEPVVAQEFVGGYEFGVFYVRNRNDERGRIISIGAKNLLWVEGDGTSDLEELILGDDRAVCLAPYFLRKLAKRLGEVPAAGETVFLSELGTHCRGAVFTDGWDQVWSEELENRIEALSRRSTGFFFGRYDVRTPSIEAMKESGEFKVLEVNGVTSERAEIYEPGNSLFNAYRKHFEQWSLAFQIGETNVMYGQRPARIRDVFVAACAHLSRKKFEA